MWKATWNPLENYTPSEKLSFTKKKKNENTMSLSSCFKIRFLIKFVKIKL